jgi:hypothetical protein
VIRNLVPVSTASRSERSANRSLYQGNCARAGFSFAVRPFPTDQCCVRLCRADLREHPTGPASATRSRRRRRPPQYAIVGSTDPLITDIWRTGSGQSKRFGEPLAVADGDGISPPPGQDGEHQGPGRRGIPTRASLATAHRPLWWRTDPRAALLATRFATLGEACSGHPEPRGT